MSYEDKTQDRNFFQVDLESGLSQEKKREIEEEILKFENVKKVGYISREESMRSLEKNLKITVPDSSIQDIMVVYFSIENSPEDIISKLEAEDEIREVFFDQEYVEKNLLQKKTLKLVRYFTIFFLIIPTIVIILSAYCSMRERNLIYFYFTSKERERIWKKSKRASSLPMIFSGIIGFFICNNIYVFLQKNFEKTGYFILKTPFQRVFLFSSLVTGCIVIIALLLPFSKNNLDFEDNNNE
ncbi:MAG: permease-like cell division protein FtsX [Fusobacteriaceae bacterium]